MVDMDATVKLTSALARLDSKWQDDQNKKGPNRMGQWKKLTITNDDDDSTASSSNTEDEFVYLLPPPTTPTPSMLLLFVGGAGLGQYPHIAYSSFLQRVSEKTNAAVLAVPYQVSLDHFALAQQTTTTLQKALLQCEEEYGWDNMANIPKYALAHSLGAKLQLLSMLASSNDDGDDDESVYSVQGAGLISYNNFGFSSSITMAKTVLEEFSPSSKNNNNNSNRDTPSAFDTLFGFAEQAIGAVGLEFTPSPSQMEQLVKLKLTPKLQSRCRVFCFDEDTLDSSESLQLVDDDLLSVSGLPGTHLTPVYLKLGLDDLEMDDTVRDVANQLSDFQSASFGNEEDLDTLVEEVYGWIVGKDVTRGPSRYSDSSNRRKHLTESNAALLGSAVDAEVW